MNEIENEYSASTQSEPVAGQVTALLDQGASFEGRLTFEGTVRIGGEFKGEVFTNDTLVINPGARVDAQIEADAAIFTGTVTTPSLRIDEGVVFEGASYMPKS
jgi:cytoskeletal protein CcmA (bactofilin family)